MAMIEEATVDAYNESEQRTGFYTMIEEHLDMPVEPALDKLTMSEFQYYEFVAIDNPLSIAAQKKLRAITSRATITATRLVNTYEWGDFKGDTHALVTQHFDAFLYYANWESGTSCFEFR